MSDKRTFYDASALMHIEQLQATVRLATFVRRMNAGEHITAEQWSELGDRLDQLITRSQDLLANLPGQTDGN